VRETKRNELLKEQLTDMNERQIALLYSLNKTPVAHVDIKTHKTKNQIAYQTARTDLIKLSKKGLLTQVIDNKKYIYIPNKVAIRRLLSTAKQN